VSKRGTHRKGIGANGEESEGNGFPFTGAGRGERKEWKKKRFKSVNLVGETLTMKGGGYQRIRTKGDNAYSSWKVKSKGDKSKGKRGGGGHV